MRYTKQTIAALCLINSASALALGVGDITTHSALNQVLNAKIPLVSSKNEDPTSISITLASRDTFKKAGIDRPQYLSDLKFTPVVSKNGDITINVTSSSSIKEPFVNFILEVEWPQGRTLKEFTILLDPPITMADITTAPVELAKSTTMTPIVSTVQSNTTTNNTPATAYNQRPVANQYGPTKSRDTLWGIAKNLISDNPSITHEQMMMALFENNPKAFYKKNINALMKGKVLSVPTNDLITELTPQQARNAFNQQNALWSSSARTTSQRKQSTPIAVNDSVAVESADPKLKLLTTDKSAQSNTSNNESLDNNADEPTDAIDQANMAIEMATTLEQENDEVKARLNELETQVEKLQRLITLKDEQLAQLQSAPATVINVDTNKSAEENTAKITEKSEESNLPLYAGGGLLIALLGLYLARRRKNDDQAFPMPESADEQHDLFAAKEPSNNIEDDDEQTLVGDTGAEMDANIEPDPDSLFSEFSPSEFENLGQIQEADPLTECDVYIAYGRYQQAEDLIQKVIAEDPSNEAYKLKLLDVYFSAENSESFENLAKELVDIKRTDPDMWDNISTMGAEICPESVLFVSPLRDETDNSAADSFSEEIEQSEGTEESIEDNITNIEEEINLDPPSFEVTDDNISSQEEIIADVPETTEDEKQQDDFEFEFDLVKPEPVTDTDETATNTSDSSDIETFEIDDSLSSTTSDNNLDAKLSLAEAYIEMLDMESAREALEDVIEGGNAKQIESAKALLEKL